MRRERDRCWILKKKWMRRLFRRRLFVALLLALQLGVFLYLLFSASEASGLLEFALTVVSILVALGVVGSRVKPAFKLTWLVSVLTFPIFGGLFYLIWELQKRGGRTARLARVEEESRPLFGGTEEALEEAIARYPGQTRQLRYLQTKAGFPVRTDSEAAYYASGREMLEAMLDAIGRAKRYIFLEYFIIEDGEMWSSMVEVLKRKAAEGLTVRVMYDDFGCLLRLPDDFARTLTGWGIECAVFNPFRPIFTSSQNNRDHRKILSVDGKIAFTGGVNLADEYIGVKQSLGRWKDAGIRVDGSAAWSLTLIFLQLWGVTVNLEEDFGRWKPADGEMPVRPDCGLVLPYCDSPTDTENVGEHVYLNIINSAKNYVYIMTPYLILDDGVISALCLAAKSGTDVRILTPQIPDKRLVHLTSRSYYPDLLAAGVRIYEYAGGFLHAKVFVSDDETATVGSTNLDFRSLYLHFECGVWMCGSPAVAAARGDFLATLENSAEIRAEDVRVTWWRGLFNQLLRLIAPLL